LIRHLSLSQSRSQSGRALPREPPRRRIFSFCLEAEKGFVLGGSPLPSSRALDAAPSLPRQRKGAPNAAGSRAFFRGAFEMNLIMMAGAPSARGAGEGDCSRQAKPQRRPRKASGPARLFRPRRLVWRLSFRGAAKPRPEHCSLKPQAHLPGGGGRAPAKVMAPSA
jgi:hypothetical protein